MTREALDRDALSVRRGYLDGYAASQGFANPFRFEPDDADIFAAEIGPVHGLRLLEIGFGEGRLLAWAVAQGAEAHGIEVDSSLFDAARAAGVRLVEGDLAAFAAREGATFDRIVAFDVFEHLTLPEIADQLDCCERLLRPGGRLILRFPNCQSPLGNGPQYGDITHVTALSLAIVEQLVARRPWRIVRRRAAHAPRGSTALLRVIRAVRRLGQGLAQGIARALYGVDYPLAPVVTIVLERRAD